MTIETEFTLFIVLALFIFLFATWAHDFILKIWKGE
jgi:hypothetical protein